MHNPSPYAEAASFPQAAEWIQACDEQVSQYELLGPFEAEIVPEDTKTFKGKWAFAAQSDRPDGEIITKQVQGKP